jgi:hypothetical protein
MRQDAGTGSGHQEVPMSMRRFMPVRGIALAAAVLGVVSALSTTGCAPMTPAQQEAAELRAYCGTRPERDLERCWVFVGSPGG